MQMTCKFHANSVYSSKEWGSCGVWLYKIMTKCIVTNNNSVIVISILIIIIIKTTLLRQRNLNTLSELVGGGHASVVPDRGLLILIGLFQSLTKLINQLVNLNVTINEVAPAWPGRWVMLLETPTGECMVQE